MQQFAHAYIIYSNTAAGRLGYAKELIKSMMDSSGSPVTETVSRRIDEDNYPDIFIISPVKGNISIDAVRSVRNFISLKPLEGTMKFVVITDCELMRSEAQNAMLKILEETPENRVIILLGAGIESMLPTVLSRLRTIRLPDAGEEVSADSGQCADMMKFLETVLLEGDIDVLFEMSSNLARSDRMNARETLLELYGAFHQLYLYLSGIAPALPEGSGRLSQHMSAPLALRISEIIRQGLEDIKANVSMNIASEAMFIAIREAYNAENSRN